MRHFHFLKFSSFAYKISLDVADKCMENLKQASGEILSTMILPPQKIVGKILCCVALVYNSKFFQNSRFTKIILTRLPTRQDGFQNRDKAYYTICFAVH